MNKNQEPGVCPECGEEGNLEYDSAEVCDEGVRYRFACPNCQCIGDEWYNMEFSQQMIKERGNIGNE